MFFSLFLSRRDVEDDQHDEGLPQAAMTTESIWEELEYKQRKDDVCRPLAGIIFF